MARVVDTREYLDMVRELLADGQTSVAVPLSGSSMTPFLHPGDMAYLDLPKEPLRRGDVVLYTRPSGQYVLHRVVSLNRDGTVTMVGDAQTELEVLDGTHRIHAIMTKAQHKGKILTPASPRWRFFRTVWLWVIPQRRAIVKILTKLKQGKRRNIAQ